MLRNENEMYEEENLLKQTYDVEMGRDHHLRCRVEQGKNVGMHWVVFVVAVVMGYMGDTRKVNFLCDALKIVVEGSDEMLELLYNELGRRLKK